MAIPAVELDREFKKKGMLTCSVTQESSTLENKSVAARHGGAYLQIPALREAEAETSQI